MRSIVLHFIHYIRWIGYRLHLPHSSIHFTDSLPTHLIYSHSCPTLHSRPHCCWVVTFLPISHSILLTTQFHSFVYDHISVCSFIHPSIFCSIPTFPHLTYILSYVCSYRYYLESDRPILWRYIYIHCSDPRHSVIWCIHYIHLFDISFDSFICPDGEFSFCSFIHHLEHFHILPHSRPFIPTFGIRFYVRCVDILQSVLRSLVPISFSSLFVVSFLFPTIFILFVPRFGTMFVDFWCVHSHLFYRSFSDGNFCYIPHSGIHSRCSHTISRYVDHLHMDTFLVHSTILHTSYLHLPGSLHLSFGN